MKPEIKKKIKQIESPPKVVKIFSEKEIKNFIDLYKSLPTTTFNKTQQIIKKRWLQGYNKILDSLYKEKLRVILGDFKMDNLQSENGEDFLGLFQESFAPLGIHADSGFDNNNLIYKQLLTPLSSIGGTVVFSNRWYGRSTTFTIDDEELKFTPKSGQNARSSKHLGSEGFDKEIHKKYLSHIDINNLKGLKVDLIYEWKLGETLIIDRSHIHCATSYVGDKKLGLTTFTKKE
tara:strand:+ start:2538 stop:3236 length:699 start_codon:yes stop_codon:yes gene_type:complete